jgi:hypothetical protein
MKTSKKILLITAGLIVALLVVFVIKLRNTVQSVQSRTELKYRTIAATTFDRLDLPSHLTVRIKQGKDCKVEYATYAKEFKNPDLDIINGELRFKVDTAIYRDTENIHVRITMPALFEIKADTGTEIYLGYFQSDSLKVSLDSGCIFTGNNNTLKHVTFQTSGKAKIQVTSTF